MVPLTPSPPDQAAIDRLKKLRATRQMLATKAQREADARQAEVNAIDVAIDALKAAGDDS